MPYTRAKPVTASESSEPSDEALKLEAHLQQQLEEDVARIFDESIYTDLEVVCGKLKILTHTCILKARTNQFYRKLETFLHVNVERDTFDEVYSFISDAYTECDIKAQEREIINYLQNNSQISSPPINFKSKEEKFESDVFFTPKCVSPYKERKLNKSAVVSPSTELTKEYYALVPIEGHLLEQELNEQDALSNAFQSIINSQDDNKHKISPRNKPTSLSLSSSHTPKTVKHSNSCDNIVKYNFEDEKNCLQNSKPNLIPSQISKLSHTTELTKTSSNLVKNFYNSQSVLDKPVDPTYSPDSLIADDPSSSSDYLSAAYAGSPGLESSSCLFQLNVEDNITKMENIFTSSDSGLENTGLLESMNSHKDVTLTDVSLTESTLHDLTADENMSHESASSPDKHKLNRFKVRAARSDSSPVSGTSSEKSNERIHSPSKTKDITKSSKEEKQRQNEEIVIMESSSVSSETGSWESVFPPRLAEKEICEIFINTERQFSYINDVTVTETITHDDNVTVTLPVNRQNMTKNPDKDLSEVSPHKAAACFIDAASLVDMEDDEIKVTDTNEEVREAVKPTAIFAPSQPVPCSMFNKLDISPTDWSESNDNDDSLEQADNKDHDCVQRGLSPTIFEMTPITEDSLSANPFEKTSNDVDASRTECNTNESASYVTVTHKNNIPSNSVFVTTTPYNSIMSLKNSAIKQYESEGENDAVMSNRENQVKVRTTRCNESSPIVSGGASIEIEHTSRKSPVVNSRKSPKTSSSAWVVDMSSTPKEDDKVFSNSNTAAKKPTDKVCESLKHESKYDASEKCNKSRGSVDSDSSEKSSHKFFIDLSSLPDASPKNNDTGNTAEKKNMFSMYIDLGENSTLKEMPSRLSSSLNTKKQPNNNTCTVRLPKVTKAPLSECIIPTFPKIFDPNETASAFETYESLCNDPNISISEIIALPSKSKSQKSGETGEPGIGKGTKYPQAVNGEKPSILTDFIQEESLNTEATDLFVKLSDLDKPVYKPDSPVLTNENKDRLDVRMTRSIPENNWGEQNLAASSRSIEVISSFHSENALSLNRLFPHLKNEFSKSMPGSLSGRTRSPLKQGVSASPGEFEEQASDMSEMSSVQSSMCRSVVENSTTETSQTSSLIGNCQSRLGQDLLRMFLEEIAPDVIVEASGKRIKAHKCILSSRCQYFAGILSGGWVESAGNVIVMPPFSFNVVHFALCHIYSGVSTIPDSISIGELATITDMLGLEGLKEAIMFNLKAKYCHHFHRPCQVCTVGVVECFPLTSVYGLDDLYRKCLRWITKYFSKVWPTKSFATLPKELLDKCYQEHIINLTTDNLIETVYGCGLTVASLQNTRWAENVARMCRRLVNAAAHYAAPRLVDVLRSVGNMSPDAPHAAKQALDDCLAAAIEWAPPDETCRAYAFLSNVVKEMRAQHYHKPDLGHNAANTKPIPQHNLLVLHASSWRLQCEGALVRAAPRVVGTQAFKDLPSDLRKRLRELGCIMYGAQAVAITSPFQERKCKSTNSSKPSKSYNSANQVLDMEHVRASFVPYKPKPVTQICSNDKMKSNSELRDIKKPIKISPPKVRTTKAQEERAKFNQTKTNQSQERVVKNNKTPVRVKPFENTKPRYLEPRPCKETVKKPQPKKHFLSSSESSRNSSPVLARNVRTSRIKAKAQAMSQDSLATTSRPRTAEPSTDSLSESQTSNKYGTYTKTKHTSKGSVESIKSPKFQNPPHTLVSSSTLNNKAPKTKIPVHQYHKYGNSESKEQNNFKRYNQPNRTNNIAPSTTKPKTERKLPGSLMNATKSSSAKMVPKIVKEPQLSKSLTKQVKHSKQSQQEEQERPVDIPVMGRSGTFLKDEPMFSDKTTDIDAKED